MANFTISLTEAQEKGIQLYADREGLASIESALEKICGLTGESLVKEEYAKQQRDLTVEEMASQI